MHPLSTGRPPGTPSAANPPQACESYSPGVLAAIAFCPSPPLLVPEVAAGAAAELDGLRSACAEAVRRLLAAAPDDLVVLGTGPVTGWFPPGSTGGLGRYGVPVTARLPDPRPGVSPTPAGDGHPADPGAGGLPLALTIGAWLLAGAGVPCSGLAVAPDTHPAEAAAALAGPGRRALLVVGDGSARRSEPAPGYVDPRAAGFDAAVAAALGTGDAAALRDLDPVLGADLLAAGVPAWRTTGAASARPTPAAGPGGPIAGGSGRDGGWDATLLHDSAPYGVGYFVAVWT